MSRPATSRWLAAVPSHEARLGTWLCLGGAGRNVPMSCWGGPALLTVLVMKAKDRVGGGLHGILPNLRIRLGMLLRQEE